MSDTCECPVCGRTHKPLAVDPPLIISGLTKGQAQRLSRVFNEGANLFAGDDQAINEWLKIVIRHGRE